MAEPVREKSCYMRRPPPADFSDGSVEIVSGLLLTMGDGSEWFHPYSGAAPVQITSDNRSDLLDVKP